MYYYNVCIIYNVLQCINKLITFMLIMYEC